MTKLVMTGAVTHTHTHTHTHTQCNLIEIRRAEDKAALLWIY